MILEPTPMILKVKQKKKKYSFFSSELDKEEKSGKTWLNEEKSITLH